MYIFYINRDRTVLISESEMDLPGLRSAMESQVAA